MPADLTLAPASRFLERLACPTCGAPLQNNGASLRCESCGDSFPVRGSVLDLRPSGRTSVQGDQDAWSDHWSAETQASFVQRFFSWCRKTVFARTVAGFVGPYFLAQGVFVEAGSGTSETSIRVNNLRPRQRPFRFHSAEISRLRSSQQGRDVLARNGFETVTVDPGPRSLMAFKTVVGERPVQPRSSVAPVFAPGYSSSSLGTPTHA